MSFRCRCFHSHKDSAVMTQIKTAHGVPVVKNCCVTNEIKCLKTKQFPFLLVHAWKEGGISYFFLSLFSIPAIVSDFYLWNTPQTVLLSPHSLSNELYQNSPKPTPTSSVMAKGSRGNIQSKSKPSIHCLPCSTGIKYSFVWFMKESTVPWKPLLESMI